MSSGASCADDADLVPVELDVDSQEHALPLRLPDETLALGMHGIVDDQRERIAEYRRRFLERDAVVRETEAVFLLSHENRTT